MTLGRFDHLGLLFVGEGAADVSSPKAALVAHVCGIFAARASRHSQLQYWERDFLSALDADEIVRRSMFLSRSELSDAAKAYPRSNVRPGLKRPDPGLVHLHNCARALAAKAKTDGFAFAVFFHDADRRDFRKVVESLSEGFGDFDGGIPMVPNPTSEAWILAALRNRNQTTAINRENAANFESKFRGNDKSPNSAKAELARQQTQNPDKMSADYRDELHQLTVDDWLRIDVLPSFHAFLTGMDQAILAVCRAPDPDSV